MDKKSAPSAFDEILSKFSSEDDRKSFAELADRNPTIREYGLRQSDYSRKMNEVDNELRELQEWRGWREKNWLDDKKMTKAELQAQAEAESFKQAKADLEKQIAEGGLGGNEVDFAQLEEWGNKLIADRKIVTQETITAKEKEYRDYVLGLNQITASAAIQIPYLNQHHYKEFGEMFEPDEFLKEAAAKNRTDLKDFYEKDFVVEKRQAKQRSEHEAEIKRLREESEQAVAKAKEEADQRVARAQGMSANGQPTDEGGPQMGEFQQRYLGLDKPAEGSTPPDVPIGEGGIAAFAARQFRQAQQAGRS